LIFSETNLSPTKLSKLEQDEKKVESKETKKIFEVISCDTLSDNSEP